MLRLLVTRVMEMHVKYGRNHDVATVYKLFINIMLQIRARSASNLRMHVFVGVKKNSGFGKCSAFVRQMRWQKGERPCIIRIAI